MRWRIAAVVLAAIIVAHLLWLAARQALDRATRRIGGGA